MMVAHDGQFRTSFVLRHIEASKSFIKALAVTPFRLYNLFLRKLHNMSFNCTKLVQVPMLDCTKNQPKNGSIPPPWRTQRRLSNHNGDSRGALCASRCDLPARISAATFALRVVSMFLLTGKQLARILSNMFSYMFISPKRS